MANEDAAASKPPRWTDRLITPALWLAATAIVLAATWIAPLALNNDYAFQDTYYVVVNVHYVMGLALVMVAIAGLYLLLDVVSRVRRQRGLRILHLGLTLVGALLMVSAPVAPVLIGRSLRYESVEQAFAFLNKAAMAGYVMTLAGLLVFAVVVVDAIRNRQRDRKAG